MTVVELSLIHILKGASKGEGLGNKFLANIRETDAIIHVLRCFDDDNVTHVEDVYKRQPLFPPHLLLTIYLFYRLHSPNE